MAQVDGIGGGLAVAVGGTRAFALPSPPPRVQGREPTSLGGPAERPTSFGRLFESSGRLSGEAVGVRQLYRKLGRVAERIAAARTELEQMKLYPPYPVDEPRRAEAIRQFNGLAAEAARLVDREVSVSRLGPNASTAEAEAGVAALGALGARVESARQSLRTKVEPAEESGVDETVLRISAALSDVGAGRLSAAGGDKLRQIG